MLHKVALSRLICLALIGAVSQSVMSACPAGQFGPGCRYDCHCDSHCSPDSGLCRGKCLGNVWSGPTCQRENKAFRKDVSQSSIGFRFGNRYPSRYAVDGNTNKDFLGSSCTLTLAGITPWWRVNLGSPFLLQGIEVYNTDDKELQMRLLGFQVYVSNSSRSDAVRSLCYEHTGDSIGVRIPIVCNNSLIGQFVFIVQPRNIPLTLCEVVVFVCAPGSYGPECGSVCGHCRNGAPCDPLTGVCPRELCALGWTGPTCDMPCSENTFGLNCGQTCGACRVNSTCDRFNGTCLDGCVEGWKTHLCNVPCEGGQCVKVCGQCRNSAPCDLKHRTGVCPAGCQRGWKNNLCDIPCPSGTWGSGCLVECGNCKQLTVCDGATGECPQGCERGWVGSNCDLRDTRGTTGAGSGGSPDNSGRTGVIVGCVCAAIIVMAMGLIGLLYYKRKNGKPRNEMLRISNMNGNLINGRENPGLSHDPGDRVPDGNHNTSVTPPKVPPLQLVGGASSPSQISPSSHISIKPIPVAELKDYIQSKVESQFGFEPEFGMLPVGLMTHADMGTLPFNRPKNRFQAIIPYDYNRIVLETPDNDPLYQYINASFIDGYKKAKAYIVSQAPMKSTSFDFWRMVWQEDVGKIVMITKLVEAGKVKSEQYWSDFDTRTFGHFVVQLESSVELADFTLRTFLLSNAVTSEQRTVKHFHLTSWPDHGVPRHPLTLLLFRKKVVTATTTCSGPMVVHCSAGIGRSGTYIALDMLIQQAARETVVDIYNTVVRLRQQRANLIPSVEQYGFLYEALLEAIWFEDTSISLVDFPHRFSALVKMDPLTGTSKLQDQFELLESVKPVQTEEELRSALCPENVVKNRHQDILAGDHHRPLLSTHHPGTTDYINAVKIPSYRQKTVFFVTEVPLPIIVMDFWRLVYDHACSTIVLLGDINLQDKACGVYWPEEIGVVHMERFQVELASTNTLDHNVTERLLKLNVLQGIKKERLVKQFHFPDWALDSDLPESRAALLYLLETVESWQQECGTQPIIIQCLDGCRCSGLFCAIYLLLERLQIDREADVFSTVRLIRDARPQFITSYDQYQFCYEALGEHIADLSEDSEVL